jgi:hypothetical protein
MNQTLYDNCETSNRIYESTSVLGHQLYFGKFENCNKCIYDKFWTRQDGNIVDIESEISLRTRPLSRCAQFKYSPLCKKSGMCTSTFDRSVPRPIEPSICSIVYNNIPRQTSPGYRVPSANICKK